MNSPGFAFGVLMVFLGIATFVWRLYQYRSFSKIEGHVIDVLVYDRSDGVDLWREIVSFVAHDGCTYTIHNNLGSHPHNSIGEPRNILYDTRLPSKAHVYSIMIFWTAPFICTGIGLLLLIGSSAKLA